MIVKIVKVKKNITLFFPNEKNQTNRSKTNLEKIKNLNFWLNRSNVTTLGFDVSDHSKPTDNINRNDVKRLSLS
jgi:hypothetical protein